MPASFRRTVFLAVPVLFAVAAGCGTSSEDNRFNPRGGAGGEPGTGGQGGGFVLDGGADSGGNDPLGDAACATSSQSADHVPLDVFIMLDQSGSMSDSIGGGGSKWSAVVGALNEFVTKVPDPLTVSVGIQFFGNGDGFFQVDSCDPADYAIPAVPIAPLTPQQISALGTAVGNASPKTGTPTGPALQGAIQYATAWQIQHPTNHVIVVLATDGDPQECQPQAVTDIANQIAAPGFQGSPSIPTYVVGVGSSFSSLDAIAAAGGTNKAYIVNQNAQQFIDAMNSIRGNAVGCKYLIPTGKNGEKVDFDFVNVVYEPGAGGSPVLFDYVANASACDPAAGGWYYDPPPPSEPYNIVLCPKSCDTVSADKMGKVTVELGCQSHTH
jgi:hypothetical protein